MAANIVNTPACIASTLTELPPARLVAHDLLLNTPALDDDVPDPVDADESSSEDDAPDFIEESSSEDEGPTLIDDDNGNVPPLIPHVLSRHVLIYSDFEAFTRHNNYKWPADDKHGTEAARSVMNRFDGKLGVDRLAAKVELNRLYGKIKA